MEKILGNVLGHTEVTMRPDFCDEYSIGFRHFIYKFDEMYKDYHPESLRRIKQDSSIGKDLLASKCIDWLKEQGYGVSLSNTEGPWKLALTILPIGQIRTSFVHVIIEDSIPDAVFQACNYILEN